MPVSKVPATDETLQLLAMSSSAMNPEVAKHFLFSGTKIIRARRPQEGQDEEAVALAIAVSTGFNTTKGALVRSMLFPKPSGFKFYKDAFRYISDMAGVAAIGFIASFINFVRLNVSVSRSIAPLWRSYRIARMAFDHCSRLGSNYNCCSPCPARYFIHWHEFCSVPTEEEADFLHKSPKASHLAR